jgi:hypothetical protein
MAAAYVMLASVIIPLVLNLGVSSMILFVELKRTVEFFEWVKRHEYLLPVALFLGCLDPKYLLILRSKALGFQILNAPVSPKMTFWIEVASLIHVLIEVGGISWLEIGNAWRRC